MVLIKKFYIWENSLEATTASVMLTLSGSGIQLVIGVLTWMDIHSLLKQTKNLEFLSGIETENIILVSIDFILTITSFIFLIFLYRGRANCTLHISFCTILTIRLTYEFGLAVSLLKWYLTSSMFTLSFGAKGLVYITRTVIWVYSLLCVYSRYQEIRDSQCLLLTEDLSIDYPQKDDRQLLLSRHLALTNIQSV